MCEIVQDFGTRCRGEALISCHHLEPRCRKTILSVGFLLRRQYSTRLICVITLRFDNYTIFKDLAITQVISGGNDRRGTPWGVLSSSFGQMWFEIEISVNLISQDGCVFWMIYGVMKVVREFSLYSVCLI